MATLIGQIEAETEIIGPFVFGTDDRGAQELIVSADGLYQLATAETAIERMFEGGNWRSEESLYMNGPEIFNFALKIVPKAMKQLLDKSVRSLD